MNVKKQIKKVAALGTSFAVAATTMVGALAYDLGDYPTPFVDDGVFNGAIVVGASAATQDVLGAIDIAASLQADSKTASAIAGSSEVTVEGGEDFDEINLGAATTYDTRLDDNDLEGFVDSDFDFDDEDMDYEDYISMANGAIVFPFSDNSSYDEDFGKDIYGIIQNAGDISYRVEIDADFNWTDVGTTGHDDDVEFKILGKTVKVTSFGDTDEMTIEASNEHFMEEGDKVTIDGHEVELKKVGENAVLVAVDGQTLSISDGETEEFDQADDFEVKVESFFYIEGAEDNSATLTLGSTISDTVTDSESAELFGEPSDEDEADWLWHIAMTPEGTVNTVGVDLNIERTGIDADEDDERNALALGDSIELPNNYASIEFSALSESSFTDITVEVDDDWDVSEEGTGAAELSNAWGIKLTSDSGADDFRVGTTDTSEVWILYDTNDNANATLEVWYEDGSDEVNGTGSAVTIQIDSDTWTVTGEAQAGLGAGEAEASKAFTITNSVTSEALALNATASNDFFGPTDEEEGGDLTYNGANIGSADYDGDYFLMEYGSYFEEGEAQFNSGNKFTFSTPDEQQEATIVVRSEGSVVSAGSSGGTSYEVNPIGLGLGVLDTDAPALGSKPMIVVGGPYANTVAAELLGNPTPEQIGETFTDGKALIRWYDDSQAMLVAGWSAQDTLGASYVVAKYDQYSLSGDEVEVVVTSLDNIKVNSVE